MDDIRKESNHIQERRERDDPDKPFPRSDVHDPEPYTPEVPDDRTGRDEQPSDDRDKRD